jgi:hypothetical protein
MTTRWRWSPRRNARPAAWPTLSAISAVIWLLARPLMPSVPKYLRAMKVRQERGFDVRQTAMSRHARSFQRLRQVKSVAADIRWLRPEPTLFRAAKAEPVARAIRLRIESLLRGPRVEPGGKRSRGEGTEREAPADRRQRGAEARFRRVAARLWRHIASKPFRKASLKTVAAANWRFTSSSSKNIFPIPHNSPTLTLLLGQVGRPRLQFT